MVRDHEETPYNSYKDMCEAHGIPYDVFMHRKRRGLSIEECLTNPYEPKEEDTAQFKVCSAFPSKEYLRWLHFKIDTLSTEVHNVKTSIGYKTISKEIDNLYTKTQEIADRSSFMELLDYTLVNDTIHLGRYPAYAKVRIQTCIDKRSGIVAEIMDFAEDNNMI